jgi:hypothetical protein
MFHFCLDLQKSAHLMAVVAGEKKIFRRFLVADLYLVLYIFVPLASDPLAVSKTWAHSAIFCLSLRYKFLSSAIFRLVGQ